MKTGIIIIFLEDSRGLPGSIIADAQFARRKHSHERRNHGALGSRPLIHFRRLAETDQNCRSYGRGSETLKKWLALHAPDGNTLHDDARATSRQSAAGPCALRRSPEPSRLRAD